MLAEKTVSSIVSSIDHKLSQILALHHNTVQSSRFPPDETASYQNRQFVEEYQTYKQPQYPQFNSRIPQNRNIGQRNYQVQPRNTYLPRTQHNYRQHRDRRQEGTGIEPSIYMFCKRESHSRNLCSAKDKTCHNYSKICHFLRACLNVKRPQQGYRLNTGFVRGDHKVKS